MPLFFIVSGIFIAASFNKRGMETFVKTKMKTILYPYFVWGCLQITLQLIFSKFVNNPPQPKDYIYLLYLPREIEQFWYLYALFNVTILYVILKYKAGMKSWQHIIFGLILFFISTWCYQNNIIIGFFGDILHYYVFIALGDIIHKFMKKPENMHWFQSWTLFFILLIPFIVTQYYFLYANMQFPESKYQHVEYFQPLLFIPISLTGCAFIISISFLFQRYAKVNWLRVLGTHSLYIYVAHVLVFASIRVFMVRVLHITYIPVLLITCIFFGLLVPVLLYKLSCRLNMQWIFSLEDKKKSVSSNLVAIPNKFFTTE